MKKQILSFIIFSAVSSLLTRQPASAAPTSSPVNKPAPIAAAPPEDKAKKDELVNQLLTEQSYLNAQIVDKCFTFKFSPSGWAAFNATGNPNETGPGAMRFWVTDAVEFAKREKIGNFMELAVDDKQIEIQNRPMIDEMIKKLRDKFSLIVEAPIECKGKAYEMMMRYPFQIMQRIGYFTPEWSPASGQAHFTVVLSPTAKDIAVKVSSDGKQFTVIGPAYTEAYDTQNKISSGLDRSNKNR